MENLTRPYSNPANRLKSRKPTASQLQAGCFTIGSSCMGRIYGLMQLLETEMVLDRGSFLVLRRVGRPVTERMSDWSERLESGANHWLPAYGFQQPADLQELLHQERTMDLLAAVAKRLRPQVLCSVGQQFSQTVAATTRLSSSADPLFLSQLAVLTPSIRIHYYY
ncbi:hypothetical protein J6590_000339 [Homalodisca vitripennis]|nr:hypothetical protein J6590_000339 [Homalodisca vitripennis]